MSALIIIQDNGDDDHDLVILLQYPAFVLETLVVCHCLWIQVVKNPNVCVIQMYVGVDSSW